MSADPTPVDTAAAVSALLRERAELQREIDGLRAEASRLWRVVDAAIKLHAVRRVTEDDRPRVALEELYQRVNEIADINPSASTQWVEELRQAARAEAVAADTLRMDWIQETFPTLFGGYNRNDAPSIRESIDARMAAAIRTPEPAREYGR